MKSSQRLGPLVYAALHSHNALFELLRSGAARRTADRDAAVLRQSLPLLAEYAQVVRA